MCLKTKNQWIHPDTPQKTYMTREKQPIEDVSPIKNGGFSIVMLVFGGDFMISHIDVIVFLSKGFLNFLGYHIATCIFVKF